MELDDNRISAECLDEFKLSRNQKDFISRMQDCESDIVCTDRNELLVKVLLNKDVCCSLLWRGWDS